ncbi:MAG: sugar isomerase domain-containing protein, partial [Candidatus Atribacteria bacterium]|nr:sugar isomerase domain-containing protein [Candidatus Atribacteria bacterium]
MKTYEEYFTNVNTIVKRIFETQGTRIEQVAEMVSDAISKDGLVHVLGVGHSHIIAEEVFWRAGTLVPIHAILEPSMIGHSEITKSAYMEKLEGTGKIICDYHRILPPDILIAISNSGNNSMPIDVAIEAKKRGVKTIGICSFTYTKSLKPRHSSGKKLMDVVDVSIDNCGQVGDTCI